VSLRRDQLIPVNKAVNKKEQLEKGLEEEEKKNPTQQCGQRSQGLERKVAKHYLEQRPSGRIIFIDRSSIIL
jgi:hypothetical protein